LKQICPLLILSLLKTIKEELKTIYPPHPNPLPPRGEGNIRINFLVKYIIWYIVFKEGINIKMFLVYCFLFLDKDYHYVYGYRDGIMEDRNIGSIFPSYFLRLR